MAITNVKVAERYNNNVDVTLTKSNETREGRKGNIKLTCFEL